MARNVKPAVPPGATCKADMEGLPTSWGFTCDDPAEHMVWVPYHQMWVPCCTWHFNRLPEELRAVQVRTQSN